MKLTIFIVGTLAFCDNLLRINAGVTYTGADKDAKILDSENTNHGQGKFKYSLKTQNGIELSQVGKLKDENTLVVTGSYSYTGADGKVYKVSYTADEFGYHPHTELELDVSETSSQGLRAPGVQFHSRNINDGSSNNLNGYGYEKGYGKGIVAAQSSNFGRTVSGSGSVLAANNYGSSVAGQGGNAAAQYNGNGANQYGGVANDQYSSDSYGSKQHYSGDGQIGEGFGYKSAGYSYDPPSTDLFSYLPPEKTGQNGQYSKFY